MEQILVKNIPDNKLDFFLELVKNLGFATEVKVGEKKLSRGQKKFVDGLKQSLDEVELHRQGKVKLQNARDFLGEL